MDFQSFPKVELHHHLDCSLSYQVVQRLDPSITVEDFQRDFVAPAKCLDLVDFLRYSPRHFALMQTAEQLRLATLDVFEQLHTQHTIYAELRFAPFLHTQKGLSLEDIVSAVNEATTEARREWGIEGRIILCTLRHYSEEESLQTVKLVKQFQGTNVVGFDLAGDEAGYPLAPHIAAYRYAIENGLHYTAHAGEASGPQSVWETLEYIHPRRIGHGARSIEDPRLIEHLKAQHIHLEICPSSNVQTNLCASYEDHPVDQLYKDGVSLSINTDSYTITDVTINKEYERLHNTFNWTPHNFLRCNLHALEFAFIPNQLKSQLEQSLRAGYPS